VSERDDHIMDLPQANHVELLAEGTASSSWVVDPSGSRVEFGVKHFWGAITVRGFFGQITGEAKVGTDATAKGQISMDATSLSTKNKQRDKHLRSKDFFDVEHHRYVVITVTVAKQAGPTSLDCQGTLDAAGHTEPIEFTAEVVDASLTAITLRAQLEIDRTKFSMTWSPLGMASKTATATAVVRFVRQ
jgi:polyisoprenoid-binding protein YceI